MAVKYKHISPVGQYDENSYWAACIEWWTRAQNVGAFNQEDLFDNYLLMRGDGGSVNMNGIIQVIEDPRFSMRYIPYYSGAQFTADRVRNLLATGPLYVGHYSHDISNNHVNVIFDITGTGSHAKVWAMEPHWKKIPGADEVGYIGHHVHRPLRRYTSGEVHVGMLKGMSSEGTGYDESYYY